MCIGVRLPDEVGEGDGAVVVLAVGGDEEEIVRFPRLPVAGI